jgi:hypothetical protein
MRSQEVHLEEIRPLVPSGGLTGDEGRHRALD